MVYEGMFLHHMKRSCGQVLVAYELVYQKNWSYSGDPMI